MLVYGCTYKQLKDTRQNTSAHHDKTYLDAKLLLTRTIPTLHPEYSALATILFTVDELSPSLLLLLRDADRGVVAGVLLLSLNSSITNGSISSSL